MLRSGTKERCESGRIGLTANELTWETGSEGSNPSLSADEAPGRAPLVCLGKKPSNHAGRLTDALSVLSTPGASHAIAVLQHVVPQEELSLMPAVQQKPGGYLNAPRPPMLKDDFNQDLVEVIEAPRRVRPNPPSVRYETPGRTGLTHASCARGAASGQFTIHVHGGSRPTPVRARASDRCVASQRRG